MKSHPSRRLPILTLAAALVAATGTAALAQLPAPAPSMQPGMPGNEQDKLGSYPFAQRADFVAAVREIALKLDERFASLTTETASAQPDATRARAIEEAKATRIILEERLGKVNQAIPENWESVRDEVLTALAAVQAAYERLAVT